MKHIHLINSQTQGRGLCLRRPVGKSLRKISLIKCIIVLVLGVLTLSPSADATTVSLPVKDVIMNGNTVDSTNRLYPFLYDAQMDLLYFPMTWFDLRSMGVESTFDEGSNFVLRQKATAAAYRAYAGAQNSFESAEAGQASSKLIIRQAEGLEATALEHPPLISFRNVLYMPLTQDILNALSWRMNMDDGAYVIESDNYGVQALTLPETAYKNGALENDMVFHKGWYYYVETVENTNTIYRWQSETSVVEPVYSYEVTTSYGFNNRLDFKIREDRLYAIYHYGGAVMGSDYYISIDQDGSVDKVANGYVDFYESDDGILMTYLSVPPGPNNLVYIPSGNLPKRPLSWDDTIFGWFMNAEMGESGMSQLTSAHVIDRSAYVIGSPWYGEVGTNNRLYKISVDTGEKEILIDDSVIDFKIIENTLYYVLSRDGMLYSCTLEGSNQRLLSDYPLATEYGALWYTAVDDKVYYRAAEYPEGIYLVSEEADAYLETGTYTQIDACGTYIAFKTDSARDDGVLVLDTRTGQLASIFEAVDKLRLFEDRMLLIQEEEGVVRLVQFE